MTDPHWPEMASIGFGALRGSLVIVLRALARSHSGKSSEWLDTLEYDVLQGIKTMSMEGGSIEGEAKAMTAALDFASSAFEVVRQEISV